MTNVQKVFAGVALVVILALGIAIGMGIHAGSGRPAGTVNNGASLINYPQWFSNGTGSGNVVYAGRNQQWAVDDSGNVIASSETIGSGTKLTGPLFGTCTINAYSTTIAASTTAQVDCSAGASSPVVIAGVLPTDTVVHIDLASSTPTTFEGLQVRWAAASTTPGYFTLKVFNGSGTTFTWSSSASSSADYIDLK